MTQVLACNHVNKTIKRGLIGLFAIFYLSACSDPTSQPQGLKLDFFPYFGDEALGCQLQFNENNEQWQIQNIGLYISEVRINVGQTQIDTQLRQSNWQTNDSALLWFDSRYVQEGQQNASNTLNKPACLFNEVKNADESVRTNNSLVVELPKAAMLSAQDTALSLSFTLGLPFKTNHENPLLQASPINIPDMFWSWRNGHKFVRIDMSSLNNDKAWSLHLGSVGCDSASSLRAPEQSCQQPNRFSYMLRLEPFTLKNPLAPQDAKFYAQSVKLDISAIISGLALSQNNSCMFDYSQQNQCNQIIQNLSHKQLFEVSND